MNALAVVMTVVASIIVGIGTAIIAARSQAPKIKADAAATAVAAVVEVVEQLRIERVELRQRIEHLEQQDRDREREIAELREAERQCVERIRRYERLLAEHGLSLGD